MTPLQSRLIPRNRTDMLTSCLLWYGRERQLIVGWVDFIHCNRLHLYFALCDRIGLELERNGRSFGVTFRPPSHESWTWLAPSRDRSYQKSLVSNIMKSLLVLLERHYNKWSIIKARIIHDIVRSYSYTLGRVITMSSFKRHVNNVSDH
jgi:hypothetical protein